MRLRDAEKLLFNLKNSSIPQGMNITRTYAIVEKELKNAKSMEAIPISWVIEWVKRKIRDINEDTKELSLKDKFKVAEGLNKNLKFIDNLINDWRKENE